MRCFYVNALFFVLFGATAPTQAQPSTMTPVPDVSKTPANDEEAKVYMTTAISLNRTDPQKAKAFLAQVIKQASQANHFTNQCSAYTLLLGIYQDEGKTDSAVYCLNTLKIIAGKAPDNDRVQINYNQSMGLYHRKTGNYKAALPYTLTAARLSEKGPDKTHTAGQWLNAGIVYDGLADLNNAMTCYFKSLRLFEQVGNLMGVSFCYNNICDIYLYLKQHHKALDYAQRSLAIKKELKDNRGICTALQSIAMAYSATGNNSKALANYTAALKIAEAETMPLDEAQILFDMARIYVAQQKDSIAIVHFKKSKTIAGTLDNDLIAAKANTELAALYKHADSLKRTESNLISNLQTFKDAGSLQEESYQYKRLSEFYTGRRQYDKALEYTHKYYRTKDSIAGNDIQVKLQNLEDQYHSVKREKEIELLKKDSQLQQAKLKQQQLFQYGSIALLLILTLTGGLAVNRYRILQSSKRQIEMERMRNQIAADLHDEVGSSLSSIHMLSQVAAMQPALEATHQDILTRMSTNARETMEKMGDIVWMIKPGENDGEGLAQRMERYVYEMCGSKNIACTFDGACLLQNLALTMQQRKNLYLIFKEALNNAVKYSDTDKLEISITTENRQICLYIKDYGKGFDTVRPDMGNGLANMHTRARELAGTLSIHSRTTEGTSVTLEFTVG